MASPRSIPASTSAEAFERYVGGQCVRVGRGPAWQEIQAMLLALPGTSETLPLPAVSEPFLAWTIAGEVEFQEREGDGPWIAHHIRKGSYFLTTGGAPYECRWRKVAGEEFQAMAVFIELPLLQRALAEVHGENAPHARLRDLSAFRDEELDGLIQRLHGELVRREASPLYVQGLAQAIAIHLARHYVDFARENRSASPSLPGFKLKQVTEWMAENLADECNLDGLAARAKLSKFHFLRLFKRAMGVSPARHLIRLRMDAARRLLRETDQSVVAIAVAVGYANPSHFAQLFRRETGLSPSDYRRRR